MNWSEVKEYCEIKYKVNIYYDEDNDDYFLCPECGNRIYEHSWKDNENFFLETGYCPICQEKIIKE